MDWGLAASAGIQAVSGLLGSKQKRGPSEKDMYTINRNNIMNNMKATIDGARENGIHPLMALGQMPSYSGIAAPSSAPQRDLSSFANAGTDLARAVTAGQTNLEKLQERLLTAQIEGQEIDNVSRASQVARTNQPGNPPGMPQGVRTIPKEVIANMGSHELGIAAAEQIFNYKGVPIPTMSGDMANAGMDDGPAHAYYQIQNTIPRMFARDADLFTKRSAEKLKRFFRKKLKGRNPYRM